MNNSIQTSAYNKGYVAGYRAGLADGRSGRSGLDGQAEILQIPLEILELTTRTRNSLLDCGCVRIADIANMPAEKIGYIRNLGRKGVDEVARALRKHGLIHTDWRAFLLGANIGDEEL